MHACERPARRPRPAVATIVAFFKQKTAYEMESRDWSS
eukprot:COSAG03_NODE_10656_length_637_cov_0.581784_2_plen_37_part_01